MTSNHFHLVRLYFKAITCNLLFVLLTACGGGGGGGDSPTTSSTNTTPTISSFTSTVSNVTPGDTVDLSWTTEDATSCQASDAWTGTRTASGTETVTVNQSSTFTLICSDTSGALSAPVAVTITVNNVTPAPTLLFSASPNSIPFNTSTTLGWSTTNATSCTASGDWLGLKPFGAQNVETMGPLQQTQSYNLVCSGPGGTSSTETVTVQVGAPPPPPPTLTLSANPTSVTTNETTSLSWQTTNATSCSASGAWNGTKAAAAQNSETSAPLSQTSTFTLVCSGPGGNSPVRSVTVTVNAPPPPTLMFSADATQIGINTTTTLRWSAANAVSCNASGDWSDSKAAVANQSEIVGPLTQTSTFGLQCTGQGGLTTGVELITVTVIPAPTVQLSADPNPVTFDSNTTLSWSSVNADSCIAVGGWSNQTTPTGAENVGPLTSDTTYTIQCMGLGGETTATENVTVLLNNNGTATLSWTPPDSNADGSRPLSDLAGYRIYYQLLPNGSEIIEPVNAAGITSFMLTGLQSGAYGVEITAIDTSGNESARSNTANFTIN